MTESRALPAEVALEPARPLEVLPRARAYAALGALCLVTLAAVAVLERPRGPGGWTLAALAAQAGLLGALAWLERVERAGAPVVVARTALLVAAAGLAALPGWFFGPNGGFAAWVVLLLLATGVLSREGIGVLTSWLVYVALASSQAVVLGLVVAGALPDRSLTPVLVGTHPMWHHVLAHAGAQAVFLVAFVAGRALRRRYAAIAAELDRSMRAASLREALLDEARNEYRRALRLGQRGMVAVGGIVARVSEPPPPFALPPAGRDGVAAAGAVDADVDAEADEATTSPRDAGASTPSLRARPSAPPAGSRRPSDASLPALPAELPAADEPRDAARLWRDAYRVRMRGQHAGVLVLALVGVVMLGLVARNRGPMLLAWACMAGVVAATLVQRALVRRSGEETVYWPWTIIGALSVGPAYSFGLHSAFACVVVSMLFIGGSFRAVQRAERRDWRLSTLAAVVLTHGLFFALLWSGVLGDDGNVPVLAPGAGAWEPLAQHVLVQLSYVVAFAGGYVLDVRFEALTREAQAAARHAARQEALLSAAGEAIERVLGGVAGEGLFTGQVLGRYRVGRLVASGGMGDVYEATPEDGGARVALKLVRPERAGDPTSLALFATEAGTLARVQSPNVAAILDVGGLEDAVPFLAMELIEGRSLAELLRERHRLPLAEVAVLVRDVTRGLRDVHAAGILHRDLKPHNLMWTTHAAAPCWKIVDFGIAQAHDAGPAIAAGTPQYMAPEQALGERVDARADLYSLSVVLYRALTGRPAFVGGDRLAIARRAREHGPPDPRAYAELPPDVALVLRLGLAAQPAERFATAAELGTAFEAAVEGRLSARHRDRARQLLARSPWSAASGSPSSLELALGTTQA